MAEKKTLEDVNKEMNARITLFDKEFQALQRKYGLRLVAQYLTPVNPQDLQGPMLVTTVPIQAFPTGDMPVSEPQVEEATKPE